MQPILACATPQGSITVYITVDWEGWSLDEENLEAMRMFRARHPDIPMLHLLNPVYYLRPNIDANDITRRIRSTLLPIDTIGLHLHGWKSLLTHCEVPYQPTPSFAQADEICHDGDCGYTVSLELAYDEAALAQLLACSTSLLTDQGFDRPRHFRAGGWQFGPKLAVALQKNGFRWDSSSTDPTLIARSWGEQSAMVKLLRELHPQATLLDQPMMLLPGLMHYPNNASLMDYTSPSQLLEIFDTLLTEKRSVMVTGFHQETAFIYLDKMEDAIRLMQTRAQSANIRLKWGRYD